MTDRRGDGGFSVSPRSVVGVPTGRTARARRVGVAVVLLAALALIVIGWLGPRLSARPNFDISFFATPTPDPSATARPTLTPSSTIRPGETPAITPLPVISQPDGVALDGRLLIADQTSLRVLDLRTGSTSQLLPIQLWRDALFRYGDDDRYGCICIEDTAIESEPARIVRYIRIDGGTTTAEELAVLKSKTIRDQPDPGIDVDLDPDHRTGVMVTAGQTPAGWRLGVRNLDLDAGSAAAEVELGTIVLPADPSPSPSPTPSGFDGGFEPYQAFLDGPHVRLSPDGRSAFVWAYAQRYSETGGDSFTQAAWRLSIGPDGSIDDVAEVSGLGEQPSYCTGVGFAADDRLAAVCVAQPDPNDSSSAPVWEVRTFDQAGHPTGSVELPDPTNAGYGEPLIDRANGQIVAWDPIHLVLVRVDVRSLRMTTRTFDAAETSSEGGEPGGGDQVPIWQDGDSAVQQSLFEGLAGSPDGDRLYAVGVRPIETGDTYMQGSAGVFVIDRSTLALVQHWAPAASDSAVTVLPGGRVATVAQPGFDGTGKIAPWDGSITIRDAADGRILARYGRVSVDMPPVIVHP